MTTPTNPRREHPSTYFVQDRGNVEELSRLQLQDQMVTTSMGGVLPEQPDPTIFQRVLDVGCGTGGWLIELAKTYPSISLLVGVDVSSKMVKYARTQAAAQQVDDRVQFASMDALLMLEFPSHYFDLVNQRFGTSYLRTWDWPKLLQEYQRVTQPGGVVRITESNLITESSSPSMIRLNQVFLEAFYAAGHLFTSDSNGVTSQLARLLQQYRFQNVQTRPYALVYRGDTPKGNSFMKIRSLERRWCLSCVSGLGCLKTTRCSTNRRSATCNSRTSRRHGGCSLSGGTSPKRELKNEFSLEDTVGCKCWNEAVDFLAITLLIRGCSSSASSLEIGLRSQRGEMLSPG